MKTFFQNDEQVERHFTVYGASGDESHLEVEYQDGSAISVGDTALQRNTQQHHDRICHLLNLVSTADATGEEAVKHARG